MELLSSEPDLASSSVSRSASLSLLSCLEAVLCGDKLGLAGASEAERLVATAKLFSEDLTGK